MDNILNKNIKVKEIKINQFPTWVRVDLIDSDGIKYQFATKKKDGTPTKSAEFYKKIKPTWDDMFLDGKQPQIRIGYKEEPKSFVGKKDGKQINFTQRTILNFQEIKDEFEKVGEYNNPAFIIEENIPIIEDDINPEDLPF